MGGEMKTIKELKNDVKYFVKQSNAWYDEYAKAVNEIKELKAENLKLRSKIIKW